MLFGRDQKESKDQRIFIEYGEPPFAGRTFTNTEAMDPYGYRAIICPGCDGACLWGEGRIDECDTCRGRGVVALRFRLS